MSDSRLPIVAGMFLLLLLAAFVVRQETISRQISTEPAPSFELRVESGNYLVFDTRSGAIYSQVFDKNGNHWVLINPRTREFKRWKM